MEPPTVDANGYGLRVPAMVISPYAKQGYIDHQTLSFDAYLKFIEDDFLGGHASTRRPTAGPTRAPTSARTRPQLGDLESDFDFNQTPLEPVFLPVQPQTDLIAPAAGSASASRARQAIPGVKALRPFEIAAAARYLVMTPAELRRELASGKTLREIAREHDRTLAGVRAAVLAAVRAELPQTLR